MCTFLLSSQQHIHILPKVVQERRCQSNNARKESGSVSESKLKRS